MKVIPLETALENRIKLLKTKKDRWLINALLNGYKFFGIRVILREEEVKIGMPFETILSLEGTDGKKISTKLKQII